MENYDQSTAMCINCLFGTMKERFSCLNYGRNFAYTPEDFSRMNRLREYLHCSFDFKLIVI